MELFARTVPANNTSFFLSIVSHPSAERQQLEAWPASTYGHLRGVSLKIVQANKVLFAETVPANNLFVF